MTSASFENILYEADEGRARITLNRPAQRNALSLDLVNELADALWEADDDRSVHCVILRAAGPVFSAGYDIAPASPAGDDGVERRTGRGVDDDVWGIERFQRAMRTLWEMHKPTIAQVHGSCLAGGTDLALYCDMVIAADDATIGFPAVRSLGAPPNHLWLYNCGPQWTKRLLLTGDTVTGVEAAQIGLILKSVPPDALAAEVEGLADRLASVDPELLAANKRIVNVGLELMGAQTLQRLAAENDARAHTTKAARDVFKKIATDGLGAALAERDAPFGDGRASVLEPEVRDAEGRLTGVPRGRPTDRMALLDKTETLDVYLVCNARYHDTNFRETRAPQAARRARRHPYPGGPGFRRRRSHRQIAAADHLHLRSATDPGTTGSTRCVPHRGRALVCTACNQRTTRVRGRQGRHARSGAEIHGTARQPIHRSPAEPEDQYQGHGRGPPADREHQRLRCGG